MMLTKEWAQRINICYAVDDNYLSYLRVSLFSLLMNCDSNYYYNVKILCSKIPEERKNWVLSIIKGKDNVNIEFMDITKKADSLNIAFSSPYISFATMYRLFLFSELFEDIDKILYLDCDTIVEGDISILFGEELHGKAIAAVEETGFRQLSYSKKAVFLNGNIPFNVDNYRTDALCMEHPECYFNAGVILLDLEECRKQFSFEEVLELLRCGKFFYNDQDILNVLFDGQVKLLDYAWNYQNNVDYFCKLDSDLFGKMYADVVRDKPLIIHYVSSHKPWNEEVMLGEHYNKYKDLCIDI